MAESFPEGFHTVTPSIAVSNSKDAIEFYKKAFGAIEIYQFPAPNGKIMHAMIQIGDSKIMMSDEFPEMNCKSPSTIGDTPVTLHIYVDDADKTFNQAVDAGAIIVVPIMNAFWGDRYGMVKDPYGHSWGIGTPQKSVSPEEMRKAGEEYFNNLKKE